MTAAAPQLPVAATAPTTPVAATGAVSTGRAVRAVRFRSATTRADERARSRAATTDPPPRALASGSSLAAGWAPERWLGSPAAGGLALPAARPSPVSMYAPRGVHLALGAGADGGDVLVVADTGNHRVLLWHGLPERDHAPCDVVLGQPDASIDAPAAGGRSTRTGLFLPTGVLVHEGRLVVADAWHHRVLVYDRLPQGPGAVPDLVLGQSGLGPVAPNAGGACSATSLHWPFGVAVVAGAFWVADTGNRRVLGWSGGLPHEPVAPDLVLGQPDATRREVDRGAPVAADGFRWPHAVAGDAHHLLVADAGDHRVLGWTGPLHGDRPADLVLGQPGFTSAAEWPYGGHGPSTLRFPYSVDVDGGRLAVADTADNRVLLWDALPAPAADGTCRGADAVLGQPDFGAVGENRWQAVERDTTSWPYGLCLRGDLLAVADSGNNRVVLWRRRSGVAA